MTALCTVLSAAWGAGCCFVFGTTAASAFLAGLGGAAIGWALAGVRATPRWIKAMTYRRYEPRPEPGLWLLPAGMLVAGIVLVWATWALRGVR